MREIDPQSDGRLSEALRQLAASSSQGAPPELGAMLKAEFHRRHLRRRRVRIAGLAAVAACMAVGAALLLSRRDLPPDSATPKAPEIARASATQKTLSTATVDTEKSPSRKRKRRPGLAAAVAVANESGDFMALPSYDPAIPPGDLQIVQLELTGADLGLVGAPVAEGLSERRFRADFLVGRDGTPYGVRLVQ